MEEWNVVNSSLNLTTKDLNIKGVNFVSLSDSQKVYIQPYEGKISVKKNRDFDFSGRISVEKGGSCCMVWILNLNMMILRLT